MKTGGNRGFAAFKASGRMKAGVMNRTEKAYAGILESRKMIGEVQWYGFDVLNLRIADNCFYKTDFLVLLSDGTLEVHEVKGGLVQDDALVKLKVAADKFPFRFVMKQLVKGEWKEREF